MAALMGDSYGADVRQMVLDRKALQAQRAHLSREIRNAERKRQRMLVRAQGLSDADLLQLVAVRAAAKAKAAAKGKAKAKAKGKAKAKANPAASPGADGGA